MVFGESYRLVLNLMNKESGKTVGISNKLLAADNRPGLLERLDEYYDSTIICVKLSSQSAILQIGGDYLDWLDDNSADVDLYKQGEFDREEFESYCPEEFDPNAEYIVFEKQNVKDAPKKAFDMIYLKVSDIDHNRDQE